MENLPPPDLIAKQLHELLPNMTFNPKLLFEASFRDDKLVVKAKPRIREEIVINLWM